MPSAITLVDMAGVETLNEARGKLARWALRLNARDGRGLPALILMTDDMRDADWTEAVRALPQGSAIVVRHRDGPAREALARRLKPICAARRVKLLIADDAGLAERVRGDGVHVPEKHVARVAPLKALHPHWLVTTSAHNARAVEAASRAGADAVLIAPAFATASHPQRAALGALRLAALAAQARVAAYALGGIDADSIARLSAARLSGVALIGGWTRAV
jgi:thiamine-phosphate pyrophosphorylase